MIGKNSISILGRGGGKVQALFCIGIHQIKSIPQRSKVLLHCFRINITDYTNWVSNMNTMITAIKAEELYQF
jgi:hypothetical protein